MRKYIEWKRSISIYQKNKANVYRWYVNTQPIEFDVLCGKNRTKLRIDLWNSPPKVSLIQEKWRIAHGSIIIILLIALNFLPRLIAIISSYTTCGLAWPFSSCQNCTIGTIFYPFKHTCYLCVVKMMSEQFASSNRIGNWFINWCC